MHLIRSSALVQFYILLSVNGKLLLIVPLALIYFSHKSTFIHATHQLEDFTGDLTASVTKEVELQDLKWEYLHPLRLFSLHSGVCGFTFILGRTKFSRIQIGGWSDCTNQSHLSWDNLISIPLRRNMLLYLVVTQALFGDQRGRLIHICLRMSPLLYWQSKDHIPKKMYSFKL